MARPAEGEGPRPRPAEAAAAAAVRVLGDFAKRTLQVGGCVSCARASAGRGAPRLLLDGGAGATWRNPVSGTGPDAQACDAVTSKGPSGTGALTGREPVEGGQYSKLSCPLKGYLLTGDFRHDF